MKNFLEDLQYQLRPFVYVAVSICFIANSEHTSMVFGGAALLGFCGLCILKARYDYRYSEPEYIRHRHTSHYR